MNRSSTHSIEKKSMRKKHKLNDWLMAHFFTKGWGGGEYFQMFKPNKTSIKNKERKINKTTKINNCFR